MKGNNKNDPYFCALLTSLSHLIVLSMSVCGIRLSTMEYIASSITVLKSC